MTNYRKKQLCKKILACLLAVNFSTYALSSAIVLGKTIAVPDKAAGRNPGINQAANGTTIVDIRTPNQKGLSHNQYLDLRVDKDGIIFNNSGEISKTQLAGYINGNNYLKGTSAKIILNEVTGNLPTTLNGYLEIAGKKASMVLANPNGIVGNNFGFINVNRATLTTGSPKFSADGSLYGFLIEKGDITINGQGMDAKSVSQTDIIAQAVKINAGLWAQDLNVVTGKNEVNYNTGAVKASANESTGVSLDVAAVGGMYANKIKLVGTAKGVGVNNAGTIYAENNIVLTQEGDIIQKGNTNTKGDISIDTKANLVNAGELYAQKNITANVAGSIDNTNIAKADKKLSFVSDGALTNSGDIEAETVLMETGSVKNKGNIKNLADSMLKIVSGRVENTNTIASNGGIEISASDYAGSGAQLKAVGGDLVLDSKGNVLLGENTYAKNNIEITAGNDIENGELVYAETGNISLNAAGSIQNSSEIAAYGIIDIEADGDLDNQSGSISSERLNVKVQGELNNSSGKLAAGKINIESGSLNNKAGDIRNYASGMSVTVGALDNTSGKLLSNGNMLLNAQDLNNKDGEIFTGKDLTLDAVSLSGDGKVISSGNADIILEDDFVNTAEVQAADTLNIKTDGSIVNSKDMLAGTEVNITAENFTNKDAGKIEADSTSLNIAGNLKNTALINGIDTYIQAKTLDNLSTGRIYGDRVAISAQTINNVSDENSAPVIAARESMSLGVSKLNNKEHAIIMSQGDLSIGGSLNDAKTVEGSAAEINNNSATIEAGGSLSINAGTLNNTNEHFKTEIQVVDTQQIVEYQGSGSSIRYTDDGRGGEIKQWSRSDPDRPDVYIYNDESDHLHTPEGDFEQWIKYEYTRVIKKDVIVETDPGKIIAGKNIIINAANVVNDKSNIVAGGSLAVDADNLQNIESPGSMIYEDSGIAHSYWRHHKHGTDTTGHSQTAYNPADTVQDITVKATEYKENTTPEGSGTKISEHEAAPVEEIKIGDGVVITADVNTDIPASSLYTVTKDSTASYIIETDPAFTNYKNWISSNYFFEKMQYDPEKTAKRLGDGYYEQQLIKDQILHLTGQRFVGNYASDEEQYQALMDNAVSFAQNSSAQIGMELTREQLAGLKENIVWMVEKSVVLPDGEIVTALVPKVYIVDADEAVAGSAVISASDVNFEITNDILNTGTVVAGNTADISANNINNVGGKIQGSDVVISALNDINNIGGTFSAKNSMQLTAGSDINVESTLRSQENNQGRVTNIASVGSISVTGEEGSLSISAGRDVNVKAGSIENSGKGDTNISAGRDINMDTVQVAESHDVTWDKDNKRHDDAVMDAGSNISASGNVNLNAGNDINAKAASVGSDKDISLTAGNDVNISYGKASAKVVEDHKHTGKSGGGHSQTITTHDELDANTVISSDFSGDNISINAGRNVNVESSNVYTENKTSINAGADVNITTGENHVEELHTYNKDKKGFLKSEKVNIYDYQDSGYVTGSTVSAGSVDIVSGKEVSVHGSNVVADNDVNIKAQENITIDAADNVYESDYDKQVKKSGLLSGGGFGFTIGKEKQKDQYANQNVEKVGSTVGSIEGSVNMEAQKDVAVKGSDVIAGKDINITGQNVDIENTENIYNAQEHHEYKRSGLTVSVGGQAIDKVNEAIGHAERATQVEDKRLAALHGYKVADIIKDNGDMIKDAVNDPEHNLSINVSIGSSKSESHSESSTTFAKESNVKAGGDVTITATEKDLNIKGSNVAGANVDLNAKGDINITSSETTNTTEQNSSSSSASVGVGFDLATGNINSVNIGGSKSKGTVNANSTVHNESTVKAEKDLTFISGKDTNIKGGKLSGDKVIGEAGGNLNIESQQDDNNYKEESSSSSIGIGITVGKNGNPNKSGIYGSASKGETDSQYDSVTDQSGIYAGEEGFNIRVEDNTDLKGGIISSEADADKNKISTGTLTYEDIHNKAEYEAGSTGINIDTSKDAEHSEAGVTPNIGMPAEDKAESDTKATIAEGEIEIRDKDKQKQDLAGLNRDTKNSLNKLGEIFDKESIQERQELAGLFGELAYNQIHDMKGTDEQKAAYHALVGGIMSQLTNGDFLVGASAAAVNKLVMSEIKKIAGKDPAMVQWLSAAVGAVVSDIIGNNYQSGASIAANATKNNEYGKAPKYEGAFKKVGDTWYQYVDGEYVKTENRPAEGVPYWVANLEDVDGMGYDYIKSNGDYASDKYVPEKIDFSWYVTIDGEAYGFTIFDQTDAQKKVVIQKGLEQYAYAVAMGSTSNNAGEIRDLVKFVEEYNKYQDTNKVQEYINDFLKGRAIDFVTNGKSLKNG